MGAAHFNESKYTYIFHIDVVVSQGADVLQAPGILSAGIAQLGER